MSNQGMDAANGEQPPPSPGAMNNNNSSGPAGAEVHNNTVAQLSSVASAVLELVKTMAQQGQHPRGGYSGTIEVKQRADIPEWTDKVGNSEGSRSAFRVFKSCFQGWLCSERLDDVLEGTEVPVGIPNMNTFSLKRLFGEQIVEKNMKIWNMLISKVSAQPVHDNMFATGSPQRAWRVLLDFYEETRADERQRLETDWVDLRQGPDERVKDYLARASVIRLSLQQHDDNRPEEMICKHIIRNLNARFDSYKPALFAISDLSSHTLAKVLRTADQEMERSGGYGDGKETRHALLATGMGRSDGSGGDQAHSGEVRAGGGPLFCHMHGPNHTHGTRECIALRREFEQHHESFAKYMYETHGFGIFPGARREMRRPANARRQQPYHHDPRQPWPRGRPQPPPPPRGYGPAPGGHPGRHPGGRGFGDSSRGRGFGDCLPPHPGGRGRGTASSGGGVGRGGESRSSHVPTRPAFPASYYPDFESSGDRGSSSEWGSGSYQQRCEEEYGYGGAYEESWGDAGGGYDHGHPSSGGEREQSDYYSGFSAAGPDAFQPRMIGLYNSEQSSSQQQQQQQKKQQQQPVSATSASSSGASPSPDLGTSSSSAAPHAFMALGGFFGKSGVSEYTRGAFRRKEGESFSASHSEGESAVSIPTDGSSPDGSSHVSASGVENDSVCASTCVVSPECESVSKSVSEPAATLPIPECESVLDSMQTESVESEYTEQECDGAVSATGRYTRNVAWVPLPSSEGGGKGVAPSPSAVAPPTQPIVSLEVARSPAARKPPPSTAPPPSARPPRPPAPRPPPPTSAPASVPSATSSIAAARIPPVSTADGTPLNPTTAPAGTPSPAPLPLQQWSPSPVGGATLRRELCAAAVLEPIDGRFTTSAVRQEGAAARTSGICSSVATQEPSPVPADAVSTPLPQPSRGDHSFGLLSQAGKDVLLSMLATLARRAKRRPGAGSRGAGERSVQCRGARTRASVRSQIPLVERSSEEVDRLDRWTGGFRLDCLRA